ncbi:protein SERAC1 isoform X3 [Rhodnius prolixus]
MEEVSQPPETIASMWEAFSLIQWWQHKKSMIAWRLLEMSQSEVKEERIKAIRTLVSLKHLQDHDYCHLAQLSNADNAVALARSKNVDLRFFLNPSWSKSSTDKNELINRLRDLLHVLNRAQKHVCLKYFLNKAFPRLRDWMSILDLEMITLEGPPPLTISEHTILPMCIQSLEHHSSLSGNVQIMVQYGVLTLLMDTYRFLGSTNDAALLLVKLIKLIATYPEHLNDLYVTGWIGVLAKWVNDTDNRLSVPAATVLTNMDRDCGTKLGKNLYLLHPTHRQIQETTAVDVVLVHGLLGGIHYTWSQRQACPEAKTFFGITTRNDDIFVKCAMNNSSIGDIPCTLFDLDEEDTVGSDFLHVLCDIPVSQTGSCNLIEKDDFILSFDRNEEAFKQLGKSPMCTTLCWPKDWLSQDCEKVRVIGLNYETKITDWLSWCPVKDKDRKSRLRNKSKELLSQLIECGIGEKPIVWISHSMGGILVKHMLMEAWKKQEDKSFYNLIENTNAVVFMSTPHYGSPLATLNEASKLLFLPSREVQELSYNSPTLVNLHKEFLQFLQEHPIKVVSFVETKSMKITPWELEVRCVPPGDVGSGVVYEIPLGHMDICKPICRFSFIYQTILQLVRSAVKE